MNEIEKKKIEEKEIETKDDEKVRFIIAEETNFGFNNYSIEKIPVETTIRGFELIKNMLNSPKEKTENILLEELIGENNNLTFYDGIILVWDIFDRIVDDYFDDDEKDSFNFSY